MKKDNRSKVIQCRLTEAGYNALLVICNKKAVEISTALREAIKDYYNKNK